MSTEIAVEKATREALPWTFAIPKSKKKIENLIYNGGIQEEYVNHKWVSIS